MARDPGYGYPPDLSTYSPDAKPSFFVWLRNGGVINMLSRATDFLQSQTYAGLMKVGFQRNLEYKMADTDTRAATTLYSVFKFAGDGDYRRGILYSHMSASAQNSHFVSEPLVSSGSFEFARKVFRLTTLSVEQKLRRQVQSAPLSI
eukprot:3534859-Amphidinium_carterae.1